MYNYIHIQRTGGTTFNSIIEKNYKNRALYYMDITIDKVIEVLKSNIKGMEFFSHHLPFGLHKHIKGIVYLCLFRDPVDRVISDFLHEKKGNWIKQNVSINNYLKEKKDYRQNRQCKMILGSNEDINDKNYAKILKNVKKIKYIGITEKFDDFLNVLKKDKILNDISYKDKLNAKDTNENITQDEKEMIGIENYYDIKLYNYIKKRL